MKTRYILTCIAALLAFCACNDTKEEVEINGTQLVLTAYQEGSAGSKTAVEDGGKQVFWEPGDEIKVFSGSRSGKFTSSAKSLEAVTTFTGHLEGSDPDIADIWAVYPYSEDAVFEGENITTVIPSVQVARPGTFAQGANVAIAHSATTNLQFYNVGGGIRFSLTETGVKKVIFEGLDEEVISGTVKVGFEEGLPKVKEVSGGSIFITLLPPDGGSFATNAWYYLTVIPGTLEKGFKLRFYKDDDTYAKVVSEKALNIKRKVFGSIANADTGIVYEATTTSFPETEQEWEQSTALSDEISEKASVIIEELLSDSADDTVPATDFISQAMLIEGVADAYVVGDNMGAVIVQKDGLHLNMMFDYPEDGEEGAEPYYSMHMAQNLRAPRNLNEPSLSTKQALLIVPYQSWSNGLFRQICVAGDLYDSLHSVDYALHWYHDEYATIDAFTPAVLSQYNLIIIATHGNYQGFKAQDGTDVGTIMMTGSHHGSIDFDSPHYSKLAAFITEGGKGKKQRYAVSVPWMEAVESQMAACPYYNKAIVVVMACNSYRNDDLADYFTSRGASIYYGNKNKVQIQNMGDGVEGLVRYLCMGMSVRNAVQLMKRYSFKTQKGDNFPGRLSEESFGTTYLIDPTPCNLKHTSNNATVTLMWDNPKTIGDYQYYVFLDGKKYESQTNRGLTLNDVSGGAHSWYVKAELYYKDELIESFQSEESSFTIDDAPTPPGPGDFTPDAIDLGLPSGLKWASFNVGATKPEEYGDYFAWGETEAKADYIWSTYKFWLSGDSWENLVFNKYCALYQAKYWGVSGSPDNKTVLDLEDDAASIKWGGDWRMPTNEEWVELMDNCTWLWTDNYHGTGIPGRVVTAGNGNSIFLPAAGAWIDSYFFDGCAYWSSSLVTINPFSARFAYFDSVDIRMLDENRCCGFSVRPVCPKD